MSDGTAAPVERGEEYVVEIEDLGREGDGIARIESFVLFIPDAELGTRVRVKVETIEENFATASIVEEETLEDQAVAEDEEV